MKRGEGFPTTTQAPLLHVDATPDESYPLRGLQVYRENCNVLWRTQGCSEGVAEMYELVNEHQRQRAALLDSAIEKLKGETR